MEIGRIRSVYKLKNVVIKNANSGTTFDKQNVLVIEDENNNRIILDLNNNHDITNSLMEVNIVKNKTKLKKIWTNKLFGNN